MTFQELSIDSRIMKAITKLGYETPMPVQQRVIPFLLSQPGDLVALAQTGSGKTAAFGIPIIQRVDPLSKRTQALVLAPTRELCLQITEGFRKLAAHVDGLCIAPIHGGAAIPAQIRQLSQGAQIVVATPGRILDMLHRGKADLSALDWLVLDEADEMLDMGFQEDLNAILSGTPDRKRVLLFSATMPAQIEAIARGYMKSPVSISVGQKNSGPENVDHRYCIVQGKDRYAALKRMIDYHPDLYAIIFCRTRIETQEIADSLIRDGHSADSLHGELSQPQRDHVMNRFRSRALRMLVATDVAARGIDVPDLTHIIQYSLPDDIEHYTHRSGRTGRAGKPGTSIVMVDAREIHRIRQIERQIARKFQKIPVPTGSEVCERQLGHLVDRVRQTDVPHAEMGAFLPAVYEKLQELSREEIIQRFLSADFHRLLCDYRNAPDLNVKPRMAVDGPGIVRLFVNLGTMERFTPKALRTFLAETARVPDLRIADVTVREKSSTFVTDAAHAELLISALEKLRFRNHRVRVSRAGREGRKEAGNRRDSETAGFAAAKRTEKQGRSGGARPFPGRSGSAPRARFAARTRPEERRQEA